MLNIAAERGRKKVFDISDRLQDESCCLTVVEDEGKEKKSSLASSETFEAFELLR